MICKEITVSPGFNPARLGIIHHVTFSVDIVLAKPLFTCGEVRARRSMGQKLSNDDLEIVAFKGQEAVVA